MRSLKNRITALLLTLALLMGMAACAAYPADLPQLQNTEATHPTQAQPETTRATTPPEETKVSDVTEPAQHTRPTTPDDTQTGQTQPTAPNNPQTGQTQSTDPPPETTVPQQALEQEAVVLTQGQAAVPNTTTAEAPGRLVSSNGEATIDYSNTQDGYVMVRYDLPTGQRLKAQVKGPSATYTYNLTPQQWASLPLSDENGEYQIVVYINVVDSKYALVHAHSVTVQLQNEFEPFLHSNQYVNFDAAPATVATAASLCGGVSDPLSKVSSVYHYVVGNIVYDTQLAATVTSGYLPDLDSVLASGKGICFDYAALMTGMLRSQGVPTKLVIGYVGDVYHAWINVWSESTGWIDGVIFFDGTSWQRMDPTFAASGASGSGYSAKYIY